MNTKDFILLHRNDDIYKLALKKYPAEVDIQMALQQISAYQILYKKVPSWANCENLIYPKHLSLEQCSSERTAIYKSKIIKDFVGKEGFSMADLTGGLGIDCYFISRYAQSCQYVEMNEELCSIAQHNFSELSNNIVVNNSSAEDFIDKLISNETYLDLIYIDPARRGDYGQKLVSIADCQPNIIDLADKLFSISDKVVIKLSPMLDITRAIDELPFVKFVYIISTNNECKELLLFLKKDSIVEDVIVNAVNIDNQGTESDMLSGSFKEESSINISIAQGIGQYLYEPYSAYLKSGLYKTIAQKYGVVKLHSHSHLYTSESKMENFPGRKFTVLNIVDFDKKNSKTLFKTIKQANITTRNFPISANDLRKQYKIKDGGEIYIFATTIYNDKKVLIICHKI